MNKLKKTVLSVAFFIIVTTSIACTSIQQENLSLDGFTTIGDANWSINESNQIAANSGKGYLVTKDSYENFKISLEFYAAEKSNSGIFFHCEDREDINDVKCYEANIFDTRSDQSGRTGAITNIAPPLHTIETEGKWNTYEVEVRSNRILVHLNGIKTVDIQDNRHSAGAVALQFMMGEIKFRNIKIDKL